MDTSIWNSASDVTKKCTRVADGAFPEVKVSWRQPGDFNRYSARKRNKLGVQNLSLTLQVWRHVGDPPLPDEFLNRLVFDTHDTARKQKNPSPRVDLMSIELGEFADAYEPNEAFVAELDSRLTNIACWLEKQPVALFETLREKGFFTNLFFTGWIDCDQLDLDLPPPFLFACGKLRLKISIITND